MSAPAPLLADGWEVCVRCERVLAFAEPYVTDDYIATGGRAVVTDVVCKPCERKEWPDG